MLNKPQTKLSQKKIIVMLLLAVVQIQPALQAPNIILLLFFFPYNLQTHMEQLHVILFISTIISLQQLGDSCGSFQVVDIRTESCSHKMIAGLKQVCLGLRNRGHGCKKNLFMQYSILLKYFFSFYSCKQYSMP